MKRDRCTDDSKIQQDKKGRLEILEALADYLVEEGDVFSLEFKSKILTLASELENEGNFVKVCVYGSLAKKTFLNGISDVDMVGYYSSHACKYHYGKLKGYLEKRFKQKYIPFDNKFIIFFTGVKIDFNFVESFTTKYCNFLMDSTVDKVDVQKELKGEIHNILQIEGKQAKSKATIEASTKYILDFCNGSEIGRRLILICKFWGYSRPKDKEFRGKSMVLECLAIYSFKKFKSLTQLFMDFLRNLTNYEKIAAVFPEYYQEWVEYKKIRDMMTHKGPIVTDPGNILTVFDFDWENLKLYASKTLEIMENTRITGLASLFPAYSQTPISVGVLDLTLSIDHIPTVKKSGEKTSIVIDKKLNYCPHPSMVEVKSGPKCFKEVLKQDIIGALITQFMCLEVDMRLRSSKVNNGKSILEYLVKNAPQRKDILGYFSLNDEIVMDADKRQIDIKYLISDYSAWIHASLLIGNGEVPTKGYCDAAGVEKMQEHDNFVDLAVLCETNQILWGLDYNMKDKNVSCCLTLTKKEGKIHLEVGKFTAAESSKALSKNAVAKMAIDTWADILQVCADKEKHDPNKFGELVALCHDNKILWALEYGMNNLNVSCCLTLTKKEGEIHLEVGKFTAAESSKALSKNAVAKMAIDTWADILQVCADKQKHDPNKFEELIALCHDNKILWGLDYNMKDKNISCCLTLTKKEGKIHLEVGKFTAVESSKALSKNVAAGSAIIFLKMQNEAI